MIGSVRLGGLGNSVPSLPDMQLEPRYTVIPGAHAQEANANPNAIAHANDTSRSVGKIRHVPRQHATAFDTGSLVV